VTADGGSTPPYSPSGGPFVPSPGPPLPPQPGFASGGARSRGAGIAIALATVAVVLAAAALIVSVVRGGDSSAPASPTAQPSTSPTAASDTTAADKALCEEVAPLLRESAEDGKNFVNLGHTGTPERDGGIPAYRAQVEDWVSRIQPILDAHADPPRYLTRSLQQLVDYTRSYAENIRPGPETEPDTAAWNNRVVAYGGPFEVCHKLGVNW
jgi:hypothetical protein